MRQTSFATMACSLARSLELVGDWWTPLIIRDLQLGVDRFDALADDLGISRNLLTTRLAHLVEHGIVARHRYQEHPPRDRYVLTEAGQELFPVLMALIVWGDRWATPEGGPRCWSGTAAAGSSSLPPSAAAPAASPRPR